MAKKTNYVMTNGEEVYRLRVTVGKKLNKKGVWVDNVKAFYGTCKSDAESKYQEYIKRKDNGNLSEEFLGVLIDKWIEEVFKQSEFAISTKKKYISAYNRIFRNSFAAGMRICDVTAFDLQKVYNEADAVDSALRSTHNLLRNFFKYADVNNICRDITVSLTVPRRNRRKNPNDPVDVWSDEELRRVIAGFENTTLRFLIILAVNSGARFAELLALTYDDIKNGNLYINKQLSEVERIDKEEEKLHIEATKTINSNRAVPLSKAVLEEFRKHTILHKTEMMAKGYKTNNIFTTSHGTYYYKRNITRAIKRLCERNHITYHSFHSFRHTFGTNLSRAGVPIEDTSKLMGHSDISITHKYYIEVDADRKRSAVEKIVAYSL